MQPAHLRDRDDPARVSRLHGASFRRVLFQRKMGSGCLAIATMAHTHRRRYFHGRDSLRCVQGGHLDDD